MQPADDDAADVRGDGIGTPCQSHVVTAYCSNLPLLLYLYVMRSL